MKPAVLFFSVAAFAASAIAQTHTTAATAKPSTTTSTTKSASTAKPSTATASTASEPWIKLPAGIPRVVHGPVRIGVAVRYEDIKVGAGPAAESGKMWHIKYTGWRAADGVKFDSWDDHKRPVIGKDGKVEMGPDGKPKMGDAEPMAFPQGVGRVIPGFDYALDGMKVGGKRRVFIPWQLAYGMRNIPDRPDHPGIPAKSDLIFDVELVEVTDMPEPPQRPVMPMRPMPPHPGAAAPSTPQAPATAPGQSAPSAAPGTAQPSAPATPPANSTPPTTATPPQPK